jgi:hypothetical protein
VNEQTAPRGLPGPLPEGEQLLWQGSPEWKALARRTFHGAVISIYFGLLLLWVGGASLQRGESLAETGWDVLWFTPFALAGIGLIVLLAWLTARTTIYSITSKRVVLSYGIAMPMSLNLPFARIGSAGVRTFADGTADIPMAMVSGDVVAYLLLWPHARPWRISKPEPTLRAVPDGAKVAVILARALSAAAEQPVRPVAQQATSGKAPGAVTTAAAA